MIFWSSLETQSNVNVLLEPVLAHMKSSGEIARLVEHQTLNITFCQRFEPHVWKDFFFQILTFKGILLLSSFICFIC